MDEILGDLGEPFAVLQFQITDRPGSLRDLLIEKGIILRDLDAVAGKPCVVGAGERIVARYAYTKITDGKPLWLLEIGEMTEVGSIRFKSWIINVEPSDEVIDYIENVYPVSLYWSVEASTFHDVFYQPQSEMFPAND